MNRKAEAWLLPVAAVALAAGILIGRAAQMMPLLLLLPVSLGACLLLPRHARFAGIQAVVLAVGCLLGFAAYHPSLPEEGDYLVSGVVAEEIRLREDGQVRTLLRGVTLDDKPLLSGAYWSFYLKEGESLPAGLAPGRRVTITARAYHPQGAENPGGYDFREYLLQKGVTIGVYGCDDFSSATSWHPLGWAAALRHGLTQSLTRVMGQEAGGYAATMILGSRNLIPAEDRQAFNRLGIAHILSVSGFHVGVVAGLIRYLMRKLHLSRKARFACTAALLGGYAFLTGLNVPVIRAVLLYLLFEFGAIKHRQRSSLHLLCASWVVQLVLMPAQLTSMSLHLTYGAMLGLTQVAPWLESLWQPRRGRKAWRLWCASLGAQAGLLLPELYWFQEIPLLGVVLNVVVMGAATGVMLLCWLTLALVPIAPLAALTGQLTAWLVNGMLVGVRCLGDITFSTLWTCRATLLTAVGWALLMFSISWWWPRKRRGAAVALSLMVIILSVVPWPNGETRYVQLSVGEADAAVLQDKGMTIAVDTGEDGEALASYLHQRRLKLDALVLTHLHADHAGGVAALLDNRIPVGVCYLPWGGEQALIDAGMAELLSALEQSGTRIGYLARGDELALPSGSLQVLWPEENRVRPMQDANASSMTLLATLHGSTMLLTGDLHGTYEMYAAHPADVLKVAHHGSESSTSEAFLQAVQPQVLLLSCGNDDRSASVAQRCGEIPLADTHASGALTLLFNENGFTLETVR